MAQVKTNELFSFQNIIFLGGTLKNLRKEHSFYDNSKIIDDIRGKSKTYVSRTSLDNNANDTEKKKSNLENTVLGIHKNKTAPKRPGKLLLPDAYSTIGRAVGQLKEREYIFSSASFPF